MGSAATILTVVVVIAAIFIPLTVYLLSRASIARRTAGEIAAQEANAAVTQLLQQSQRNAENLVRQAERDAEALLKEAAISAREKAHEIGAETERISRERRQEILTLEQALADKTRTLADRITATDRLDQDLRGREKALAVREQTVADAHA